MTFNSKYVCLAQMLVDRLERLRWSRQGLGPGQQVGSTSAPWGSSILLLAEVPQREDQKQGGLSVQNTPSLPPTFHWQRQVLRARPVTSEAGGSPPVETGERSQGLLNNLNLLGCGHLGCV